jgi:hypothetical protein
MTEISKEWCLNMAKQEEGDISAGKLAIDRGVKQGVQNALDSGANKGDIGMGFATKLPQGEF